jgi:hypothetical protein
VGERHRPIRARSAPGQVAGAATETARTRSPSSKPACPTAFSTARIPCARCPATTRRTRGSRLGEHFHAPKRGSRGSGRSRPERDALFSSAAIVSDVLINRSSALGSSRSSGTRSLLECRPSGVLAARIPAMTRRSVLVRGGRVERSDRRLEDVGHLAAARGFRASGRRNPERVGSRPSNTTSHNSTSASRRGRWTVR